MAISAVMFVIFRVPMVRTVSQKTAEVIRIASELMIIAALFQFFDGVQAVSLRTIKRHERHKSPVIHYLSGVLGHSLASSLLVGYSYDRWV